MNNSFLNILFNKDLSPEDKIALLQKEALESTKSESLDSSIYERDRFVLGEQCKMEYDPLIWNKLSSDSQKNLMNAYFYAEFIDLIDDDDSTPIFKLTKTVENEIRDKLFIEYAVTFKGEERIDPINKTDIIFDNFLVKYLTSGEPHIQLGDMLHIIKFSSNDRSESFYSRELKQYLIDYSWDIDRFYAAKRKNFYISYPTRFRNKADHHNSLRDHSLTVECKVVTKEILTWFIGSMK